VITGGNSNKSNKQETKSTSSKEERSIQTKEAIKDFP